MSLLFDVHTHILPRFDDGSRSGEESFAMLRELYKQGVSDVIATPHFYATDDEPLDFLQRRKDTAVHLSERIKDFISDAAEDVSIPRIYLGAEVAFFNAMSNVAVLRELCITGTDYLLVEMPFERWTDAMTDELWFLQKKHGITPVIAHIDRYFRYFDRPKLKELLSVGIKVQINADAFLHFSTRSRALDMLESGKVHFIGSDSHNMGKRSPNIKPAMDEIEKRLGKDALARLRAGSEELRRSALPVFSISEGDI